MQAHNVLFTAPMDFDPKVFDEFPTLKMSMREPVAWVCDPKTRRMIDGAALDAYPLLKVLGTPSTGMNHIDMEACAERNIKVVSLNDNRRELQKISASSEFTFKLLLDAFRLPPARELQGKKVGIIGYGRIGRRVKKWVQAFDAQPVIYDPVVFPQVHTLEHLVEMFKTCDAIVVSCVYNKDTHHLIAGKLIRSMPHGAALVNTARGEVIDEQALVEVLDLRTDLRVAVDVLEGEVTGTDNSVPLQARGAIVTPHIAGETYESRTKAARIILELVKGVLDHGN